MLSNYSKLRVLKNVITTPSHPANFTHVVTQKKQNCQLKKMVNDIKSSMKETDIYRDTPVRYLGYANEVGESFRSLVGSKWVAASYGVATLYVLADTFDKTTKVYQDPLNALNRTKKAIYTAGDTLIWQMLASVAIPGFTINRVCAGANYLLKQQKKLDKNPRKWVVTAIGLATIPFIIKPIDHLVDAGMDNTFRKIAP